MSDVSNLVKQTSYDAKISDIKNKSITAADYNLLKLLLLIR